MNTKISSYVSLAIVVSIWVFAVRHVNAAPSHASDDAIIRSEIHQMDVAGNKGDAAGAVKYEASDYTDYDAQGKVDCTSKEQNQKTAEALFSHISSISIWTTVNSITYKQNSAVVVQTADGTFQVQVKGQLQTIKLHEVGHTYWIKSGGIWLDKQDHTLSSSFQPIDVPSTPTGAVQ